MIYDKYGLDSLRKQRQTNLNRDRDRDGIDCSTDKKKIFKKCNSLKNLKNRNTCDEVQKYRMKRQASSPYLRSASTNHNANNRNRNKLMLSSSSPEKIYKLLQHKSREKESITRSLSKKNLKNKNLFNIDKSIQNQHYSKPLKKRSSNGSKNSISNK